ncbi:MAG: hypothetical protein KDA84_02585, partial [Planctomycetaceae bacterium]|nr:hypothetical protein [Planctomycetaceae bacterium]
TGWASERPMQESVRVFNRNSLTITEPPHHEIVKLRIDKSVVELCVAVQKTRLRILDVIHFPFVPEEGPSNQTTSLGFAPRQQLQSSKPKV